MTDAAASPQEGSPVQAQTAPEPAAQTADDYAALLQKVRSYEGRDRAFQQLQAEHAQQKQDLDAARALLADHERANMSELEKAQRERDDFKAKAAQAAAEAQRIKLTAKFPHAAAAFGEGEPLPSEDTLSALEKALTPPPAPAQEPNAPIVHNPQKSTTPETPMSAEARLEAIRNATWPEGWR